jgi:F0F1-type ATP synthase assembly protein I
MPLTINQTDQNSPHSLSTQTILSVAVQVGCLTLIIILAALIVGLMLDRMLETLPLFTILFLVGSMPVTWVVIFGLVNRVKKQFLSESMKVSKRVSNSDLEERESD